LTSSVVSFIPASIQHLPRTVKRKSEKVIALVPGRVYGPRQRWELPAAKQQKHTMKPASQTPNLFALAQACDAGACNLSGLARSLPAALDELESWTAASHPAVQVIIGQLAWLCGQAVGPTTEAYDEYRAWRASSAVEAEAANA
jgi:hypothetical protein